MKLRIDESPVYSSGQIQQKEFKITASAKAFKILSSNLYTNKIRAIIRELSTNALDAHKAFGEPDKQFKIHLPSAIDPIFWIRDYGTGLSKEQVLDLYTTYFESTKADSNDYVGALGLGSKSPFSYVDSFMVTSFFNGTKTIYDMSLKGGVPNVAVLHESETDEENGLHIAVSVNHVDINRFRSEAMHIYKTFTVKPIMEGHEVSVEMDNVNHFNGYFTANDPNYPRGCYALMGNIAYPLNYQIKLGDLMSTIINNQSVFVEFDLGTLDITPSREELSYDDETIAAINDKLGTINKVLRDDILKPYEGATNVRETWELIAKQGHMIQSILKNNIIIENKNMSDWSRFCSWDGRSNGKHVKYRSFKNTGHDSVKLANEGTRYWDRENLAAISLKSITILKNDDNKTPSQTVKALIEAEKIKNYTRGYVFNYETADEKLILDNLLEVWEKSGGIVHLFVNSELADLKKAYNKKYKAAPVKRGTACKSVKLMLDKDPSGKDIVVSKDCVYYSEDIKKYDGQYAFKYFDDYVEDVHKKPVVSFNAIREYMIATQTDEVLIVRSQHWKAIRSNPDAVFILDAINETVAAQSGRQVGRKTGSHETSNSTPSWVTYLASHDASLTRDLIGKRKFTQTHKFYPLFKELFISGSWKARGASKSAIKQLNRFVGQRDAIIRASNALSSSITTRFPLITEALRCCYSSDGIKKYVPELTKILK